MTDLYLAFPDQATADAVLYGEEDKPNYANIDTIGVIYKDEQAIPGWHVNVRVVGGEDATALEAFAVTPATPMRVWA
jgi:hypothetical protein